jgi:20S proteasome alpha/beta subunit
MTLISALRCREGVVLTSDSREASGEDKGSVGGSVQKIYEPRSGFLVAWAGYKYVAQAFALAMRDADGLSSELNRVEIERRLVALLKQLRADGKTDLAEWIIAWWSVPEDAPLALQLFSSGTSQWVEEWDRCGSAEPRRVSRIVSETLAFVPRKTLSVEQAKMLALKIMRDTIHINPGSIAGPPQLGAVTRSGIEIATPQDLEYLTDALGTWEEQAAGLLPGAVPVPAQSKTPDRGVRLPGGAAARPRRRAS